MTKPLSGKIALVAGSTRGAGRGIARMLGEAGATVYCSGRSVTGQPATGNRTETIEETAELVTKAGGLGIWKQTDHSDESQIRTLLKTIKAESGKLDILVNSVWGGDSLMEWDKSFAEQDISRGLHMQKQGVFTHMITNVAAAPLLVESKGLLVEMTDGEQNGYRGTFFYDMAKASVIRIAYDMAWELGEFGVTALAVTPGFLRSEEMLDRFGVEEENWQDAVKQDPFFAESETPAFVGRAVAALAADPNVSKKAGKAWGSWTLSQEYGFADVDGRKPHWGNFLDSNVKDILAKKDPDEGEMSLLKARYRQIHQEAGLQDYARELATKLNLDHESPYR